MPSFEFALPVQVLTMWGAVRQDDAPVAVEFDYDGNTNVRLRFVDMVGEKAAMRDVEMQFQGFDLFRSQAADYHELRLVICGQPSASWEEASPGVYRRAPEEFEEPKE